MKRAETEGTDICNFAETEGTDVSFKKNGKKNSYYNLLITFFFIALAQNTFASELNLYSTSDSHLKGIFKQDNNISFVEGFIENGIGYFIAIETIVNLKATNDGTGDKATNDGTGGKATNDGTGGKATNDGTGGKATNDGTGKLITVNFSCNNQKYYGNIETTELVESIELEKIEINGSIKGCIE